MPMHEIDELFEEEEMVGRDPDAGTDHDAIVVAVLERRLHRGFGGLAGIDQEHPHLVSGRGEVDLHGIERRGERCRRQAWRRHPAEIHHRGIEAHRQDTLFPIHCRLIALLWLGKHDRIAVGSRSRKRVT